MNSNTEKWVKALESGDYLQTRGFLERKAGTELFNCCLGVACRVYAKEHPDWNIYEAQREGDKTIFGSRFGFELGHTTFIPTEVSDWLDLRVPNADRLMGLNDGGSSFVELAEVIRGFSEND